MLHRSFTFCTYDLTGVQIFLKNQYGKYFAIESTCVKQTVFTRVVTKRDSKSLEQRENSTFCSKTVNPRFTVSLGELHDESIIYYYFTIPGQGLK